MEFLRQTFYGNTILEWITAAAIVIAALAAGKLIYWLCKTVLRSLAARSANRIDDLLVDIVEEPVVFGFTAFGIWVGLGRLHLSERADRWVANGVQFLLVLAVTWVIARLLDAIFRRYLAPLVQSSQNDLDDQLLPIIRRSTAIAVWSIGVIVALNNAGYNVAALLAGLGIGGLALAMAAQDTVSNVFGGFTIFTDQPFKLNDRVKVSGFDGHIREIGLRSTRLQTLAGTVVTIPNSTFADTAVENISREPARKVSVELGLTYDTTAAQVERALALLLEIASAHPDVAEDPEPWSGFNGFGASALEIELIYRVRKEGDIFGTQTAINLEILRRFGEEGLEMAFPTQTIHLARGTGAA